MDNHVAGGFVWIIMLQNMIAMVLIFVVVYCIGFCRCVMCTESAFVSLPIHLTGNLFFLCFLLLFSASNFRSNYGEKKTTRK